VTIGLSVWNIPPALAIAAMPMPLRDRGPQSIRA
jgi:hypothetical protein